MKHTRHTLLLAIIIGCMLVASPTAWAQSLFSQNKPEQAAAARVVIEDATVAMRASREAAAAKGDTAAVAKWDKAIAAATQGAALAAGIETGNPQTQDAALAGLAATLGPWGVLATPFLLWALREWRLGVALKAVKKAEADAKAAADAARTEAKDNLEAAKSIVNGVDRLRIASPAVAAEMKRLTSDANTDFTAAFTEKASAIIEAERLT